MLAASAATAVGERIVPTESGRAQSAVGHLGRGHRTSVASADGPTFDVDRMQPDEQSAVIAALARAFYDDPLFGFFVPDLVKQPRRSSRSWRRA